MMALGSAGGIESVSSNAFNAAELRVLEQGLDSISSNKSRTPTAVESTWPRARTAEARLRSSYQLRRPRWKTARRLGHDQSSAVGRRRGGVGPRNSGQLPRR